MSEDMRNTEIIDIEIHVVLDENGDYATGVSAEEARDGYDDAIGDESVPRAEFQLVVPVRVDRYFSPIRVAAVELPPPEVGEATIDPAG